MVCQSFFLSFIHCSWFHFAGPMDLFLQLRICPQILVSYGECQVILLFVKCTLLGSLVPNLYNIFASLLRYFFAEVFDFFRTFFLIVFHVNILFMILPLAIRLNHRPCFLAFLYIAVSSMLKSYPSVSLAILSLKYEYLTFFWLEVFLIIHRLYSSSLYDFNFAPAIIPQHIILILSKESGTNDYFFFVTTERQTDNYLLSQFQKRIMPENT